MTKLEGRSDTHTGALGGLEVLKMVSDQFKGVEQEKRKEEKKKKKLSGMSRNCGENKKKTRLKNSLSIRPNGRSRVTYVVQND